MVGSTCDFSVLSGPGVLCYVPITSYEHYWTVGAFFTGLWRSSTADFGPRALLRARFDLKIKKKTGFSDIFLLKSPRTVIPNLGTHRTELRQVRDDFEVFEWSLTVLRTPRREGAGRRRDGRARV